MRISVGDMATLPIWLPYQYGYLTNMTTLPIWLPYQYGYLTNMATLPIWLPYQYDKGIPHTVHTPRQLQHLSETPD